MFDYRSIEVCPLSTADQLSVASMRLLMPLAMFLLSLKSIRVYVIEEVNNLLYMCIVSVSIND